MTSREAWEALEAIRVQHGGALRPEFIVDAARGEDHPLHGEFVWEDTEAAELYRRDQARQLIRRIRLIDTGHLDVPRDLRAYVSVRTGGQPSEYLPTEQVAADPVAREIVLRTMEREWRALFRRYREFSEFASLVMDDLESVGNLP